MHSLFLKFTTIKNFIIFRLSVIINVQFNMDMQNLLKGKQRLVQSQVSNNLLLNEKILPT